MQLAAVILTCSRIVSPNAVYVFCTPHSNTSTAAVVLHAAADPNLPLLLRLPLLLLQVEFSGAFQRAFENLTNVNLRESVTNAMERLARGKWPIIMRNDAAVPEQYRGIIQVLWVEGLRVIWMVDVDHDTRKQVGGLCSGMV
jgi:hypothetical protein